jgi:hypothetical protein
MSNPIEEALELVLTDVEWYHKSPTKRVIIKALTALQSGELVVVGKMDISLAIGTVISTKVPYSQIPYSHPANVQRLINDVWNHILKRREEDTNAES